LSATLSLALPSLAPAQNRLPALAESRPVSESRDIDEEQVFLVRANGVVTARQLTERVFCDIEGVRSADTVRVIGGQRKAQLLAAAGVTNPENWIAFRCTQTFPQGADVIIRWDAVSPASFAAADYLRFKVRSGDWLEFACGRENREAGCNPLSPVTVTIRDRALAEADLKRFALRDAAGKLVRPLPDDVGFGLLRWPRLAPETSYTLVVPPGLREEGTGTPLPPARPVSFKTAPYPPLVKFARSFGILERNADPALPITVRNLEAIPGAPRGTAAQLRRLRVTGEAEMIRWYARTLGFMARDRSMDDEEYEASFADEVKAGEGEDLRGRSLLRGQAGVQTLPIPKTLGPKEFEVVGLPLAEPGLHVVEAESSALGASHLEKKGSMFVRSIALVTNLAVHVKTGPESAFVWVTRLDNAQPVGDAQVRLRDCKGGELAATRTSPEGLARLTYRLPKAQRDCPLFVFASAGDDTAFTRSDWTRGIEWWRFNLPWDDAGEGSADGKRALHTVLARNLLRPGETVHMKHFARALKRFGTGAPDVGKLPRSASIVNEGTNERTTLPLTWSARGNAASELRLPPNAKRGQYTVQIGDVVTGRFTVADFRLPVYKAEVALPRANVASGDPAAVDVRLSFLAGGAASGDTITARSRVDVRTWNGFEVHPEYSFALGAEPEILKLAGIAQPSSREPKGEEMTLTLDGAGSARVMLPTPAVLAPASLIADIEYRDPNGEIYTAQARGTVWPGERLVGIRVADWAMARERIEWELVTTDVEGRPIGDVAFTVRGIHRSWDHYRRRNIGGFYSYESNETLKDLGVLCQGRSDRAGRARCNASVAVSGEVVLIATVEDAKGRTARSTTSLWAANGDDWMFRFAASDRIDLLPEKTRYEPGERARFQVRMPFREATALVTVEREGQVLWSTVTKLSGKAAVVEVPMREEWAPNAYVSALLVRGRVGEPAPTATVDLGRPAFRLGVADVDIHWQRYQLNVAVTTERQEYRTRDRVPVKIRVERANNRQPADGSEVVVFAIDEALLELQPNPSWKLLEAMMKRRGYGVTTATAQMQVIGKRHYGRKALPPGGSGGRGAGTRELFDTLVFWKADVLTDARGEATVEVPLNDSLTRFRIVAVAERSDPAGDRFGTGETSVRTTRDLQLFAGIPSTVRHGDAYRASVSLRNMTSRPIVAEVTGQKDEQSLPRRELSLAPGQTALVSWEVTAPTGGRESVWLWEAREKGAPANDRGGDSLRVRQALATPLPPRLVAAADAEIRQGRASLSLAGEGSAHAAATPGAEVAVTVARTYGTDTSGIRRYFESYPFACLEQRMVKAMGTKREDLWQRIVEELPGYLSAGGLAYYYPGASGEGHAVLTAFVLAGAHEAGWSLPDDLRERMLSGLEGHVTGRVKATRDWLPTDAITLVSDKLIALEALSRYGRVTRRLIDSVGTLPTDPGGPARPTPGIPGTIPVARLTAASVADWVDVLARVKDVPNAAALRAQAIAELRNAVHVQGGTASVTRNDERWYFMRGTDYTLARMLRLSLELPELSAYRIPLVRTLNNRMQRAGHLSGTQANLWAAYALERHAATAQADGRTRVTWRGETREIVWSPGTTEATVRFTPAADAPLIVAIEHAGRGEPWARAVLRAPVPLAGAVNSGLAVSKSFRPVQQQTPGRWRVGDVVEVTVAASAGADIGWLAIDDAVPAGATVLGGLARLGAQGAEPVSWKGQRFIERAFTHVRAAFEWAPKGAHRFTYQMRLTTPGRFALPPTHAEAMYAPEINGQRANDPFVIEP
jgi:uncharacterized protein YfaS (alpha-2-macroglobulin family)